MGTCTGVNVGSCLTFLADVNVVCIRLTDTASNTVRNKTYGTSLSLDETNRLHMGIGFCTVVCVCLCVCVCVCV